MLTALLFHSPPLDHPKVSVHQRVVAKVIDILIMVGLATLPIYPVGPLLGFVYSLMADGMSFGPFRGQSVGKRLMKIRVIRIPGEGPIAPLPAASPGNYKDSLVRNAPVGVATFFAIIPIWGWLILLLIGLPLMLLEIYLMTSVQAGHRLGDFMAGTEVVESGVPRSQKR